MEYPAPHETIFSIPFTKIEIRILNYAKPTYHDLCSDCAVDAASHTSQQEQAYDAGYDAGYNKGMIDAHDYNM